VCAYIHVYRPSYAITWPWPSDLDIITWPRYFEDVPAYQKWTLSLQNNENYVLHQLLPVRRNTGYDLRRQLHHDRVLTQKPNSYCGIELYYSYAVQRPALKLTLASILLTLYTLRTHFYTPVQFTFNLSLFNYFMCLVAFCQLPINEHEWMNETVKALKSYLEHEQGRG